MALLILALTMSSLLQSLSFPAKQALHPLILIPGAGGNQLEARLTTEYRSADIICRLSALPRYRQWFRLWFDPFVLISPLARCFAERMKLTYDVSANDYRNAPGVETRVPHFGSTESLLYLDPHLKYVTEYMGSLVSALKDFGYREGQNLFGAPYDFRYGLAPLGQPSMIGEQYLDDLRALIESAAATNEGRPVILVSHSLGGLFALHLLDRSSASWRRQFVKHLVVRKPASKPLRKMERAEPAVEEDIKASALIADSPPSPPLSAPAVLNRQELPLRSNFSLNASCSSDASTDSFCSRASTGIVNKS